MFIFKAEDHYPVTIFAPIIAPVPDPTSLIFLMRVIKITFVNNREGQLKELLQQNNNSPKCFYGSITV